jgi:hypothetical protein
MLQGVNYLLLPSALLVLLAPHAVELSSVDIAWELNYGTYGRY